MSDRTKEQDWYRSLEDEVLERDTIELDEEKGSFRTKFEDAKEKINEKAGDGASGLRYIVTGGGMGYLVQKLSPIPIRLPWWLTTGLGAGIGGLTWYENREKIKKERDIRKEVRRQARELDGE